jgi:hypothetical protein
MATIAPISSLRTRLPAAGKDDHHVWRRWIAAMMLGELAGFVAPAVAGAIAYKAGVPDAAMLPILVCVGSLEGAALGYAQSGVLAGEIAGFSRRDWTLATTGAAALAWGIGMIPSSLGSFTEEHPAVIIAGALVLAPVLLNTIGVAQWLILRRHVERSDLWITANALGWLAGLPAVFIAMMAIPNDTPVAARAAAGVVGAVAMGGIVAGVTGAALVRILRHRRTTTAAQS